MDQKEFSKQQNITVIDVREEHEVANGMIPGATNIPLQKIINEFPALEGKVVFYCETGARSLYITTIARQRGIDAYNLENNLNLLLLSLLNN